LARTTEATMKQQEELVIITKTDIRENDPEKPS
jgi:hypothetical protein